MVIHCGIIAHMSAVGKREVHSFEYSHAYCVDRGICPDIDYRDDCVYAVRTVAEIYSTHGHILRNVKRYRVGSVGRYVYVYLCHALFDIHYDVIIGRSDIQPFRIDAALASVCRIQSDNKLSIYCALGNIISYAVCRVRRVIARCRQEVGAVYIYLSVAVNFHLFAVPAGTAGAVERTVFIA